MSVRPSSPPVTAPWFFANRCSSVRPCTFAVHSAAIHFILTLTYFNLSGTLTVPYPDTTLPYPDNE